MALSQRLEHKNGGRLNRTWRMLDLVLIVCSEIAPNTSLDSCGATSGFLIH